MKEFLFVAAFLSIFAIFYAVYIFHGVLKKPRGSKKIIEISDFIKDGAKSFMRREYYIISIFAVLAFFVIALSPLGIYSAIAFLIGALFSAITGLFGMKSATETNSRTTNAAQKKGMIASLNIAFKGGSVMGMSVVGFGLLGVVIVFTMANQVLNLNVNEAIRVTSGYSLGASCIALFARVGGGIFTKAADIGADLTGKIEEGIPEDDPRNPAVIADNVGDNVGDVAGMGSDLFESYVSSIIGAAIIGEILFGLSGVVFVIVLASFGILASMIGTVFVRGKEGRNPYKALKNGTYSSVVLFLIMALILNWHFVKIGVFSPSRELIFSYAPFVAVFIGTIIGLTIAFFTEYYTAPEYRHVKEIVKQSETGHATNVISGLAIGMQSTAFPVIIIAMGTIGAFYIGGLYGIGLAAIGMLGTTGMTVSVDSYGPIADNAGGIAQMANLDQKVRDITDKLDSVGNTTAAIAKGFAIGSAALTALVLFSAFSKAANLTGIDISKPRVIAGLMIGGMIAFLFSSLTIKSVGKTANKLIVEVRRQFKNKRGILEGKELPDYDNCIKIATDSALREMILPAILAIGTPLFIGFVFGAEALGGLLAGTLITGLILAIFMANSGGAWDNAKKYVEAGNNGGKNSDVHKATVTGDTVGDPLKDTSGPAIDILIKLMTTISLVCAALFGSGLI